MNVMFRRGLYLFGVLFFTAMRAEAFLSSPVYIGTSTPIRDVFGHTLVGSATLSPDQCARVEVLMAPDGIIYPPNTDGTPDPRNPLLEGGISHLGARTAMGLTNAGIFFIQFTTNKPAYGAKLFIRAFNAPTRNGAAFYGDSEVFTIAGVDKTVYDAGISAMSELDVQDEDGDGLSNSMEKYYGTDSLLADSDGDGLHDGEELRAGTDPMDAQSVFMVYHAQRSAGQPPLILWTAVEGKQYQLEYTSDPLSEDPSYTTVGAVVTADRSVSGMAVPQQDSNQMGFYRVRLVEE